MKIFEIVITENDEDAEIGGFFAYDGEPLQYATRGWGPSISDAVMCLMECLKDEGRGLTPVAADVGTRG